MTTVVTVPDIGDFKDVAVIEIMVKPGDTVSAGQSVLTVESDKASMEIPCEQAGVVKTLLVTIGSKISKGSPILEIEASATAAAPTASPKPSAPPPAAAAVLAPAATAATAATAPPPAPPPAAPPPLPSAATLPSAIAASGLPYASPSVRKFARELGVDLSQVKGSEDKGRITHQDVQDFVKNALSGRSTATGTLGSGLNLLPWPSLDFSAFGPTHREPLSRIKKISGANLARNWAMIPHVTQFDEADITDLEAFRQAENRQNPEVKLTILAFVIKAAAALLKRYPSFNASLDEAQGELILKDYFHIGFAADTPQGLTVPVVKNVDGKGINEIANDLARLSKAARDGKLGPKDMQGAGFTISSLGGIGGTAFTPIINAPEVAILGLSKSSLKPVWDGERFSPRLMLPLSLSYDHRVIDGAQGARFIASLVATLSDMRKILL